MLRIVFILILLSTSLFACSRSASDPLPSQTRIVTLSPAIATILKDLNLESHIVGRHGWDIILDKSLPICGDQSGINYEALLQAHPTHILTQWGQRKLPARLSTLVTQNNWVHNDYQLLTLNDIRTTTKALGQLFDAADRADKLIEQMNEAWAPPQQPLGGGTVLLLMSATPAAAIGPGSFHHQILERIGATPALTTGKPYMQLDIEDVLRLNPDTIILIRPPTPALPTSSDPAAEPTPTATATTWDWQTIEPQLGAIAKLQIPAITNQRVHIIDDPLALTPGTSMIRFAQQLARALAK